MMTRIIEAVRTQGLVPFGFHRVGRKIANSLIHRVMPGFVEAAILTKDISEQDKVRCFLRHFN